MQGSKKILSEIVKIHKNGIPIYYDCEGIFGEACAIYCKINLNEIPVLIKISIIYGTNKIHYYPTSVPYCKILSFINHPNVSKNGDICFGELKIENNLESYINAIIYVLNNPDWDNAFETNLKISETKNYDLILEKLEL